jgi:hypothetical protein
MKKFLPLFILSLILVFVLFIPAQSSGWTPWRFLDNFTSRLNLTPEQIINFEKVYHNFIKDIYPIQNLITTKTAKLRNLRLKSPSNNTTIINTQKEISSLELKFQEIILNYRLDALNILTTDQILMLPSDCSLGINLGRGNRMGFGRGYGIGLRKGNGNRYR